MKLVATMFSIKVSTKVHRRFCICAQIGNAFASNTKQKPRCCDGETKMLRRGNKDAETTDATKNAEEG